MDLSRSISNSQYRYYFGLLKPEQRRCYETLLSGYMRHREKIVVHASCIEEVWEVQRSLCYDVPELFFIKTVRADRNPVLNTVTVIPEYRFKKEVCVNILDEMEAAASALLQRIAMLPEYGRVKQIHDYLSRTVKYRDLQAPYSHEAPGALIYHISVCEGIAKAFKYLADRSGLKAVVVTGDSRDMAGEAEGGTGHAWNVIEVDSQNYHIDVTFDAGLSQNGTLRYDYFLLSDEQIRGDHTCDESPRCGRSYEYYQECGCYVDSKRTLRELVKARLRPKAPLVFKLPDFEPAGRAGVPEMVLGTVSQAVAVPYALCTNVSLDCNLNRMIFLAELSGPSRQD